MQKIANDIEPTCTFLGCKSRAKRIGGDEYWRYCHYNNGGIFGSGESFEQYQIIEQDFLDFIKVVLLNEPNHLIAYSPVLRDIIIRCCVQIEVFFKEWGKFKCSEDPNFSLLKMYNKNQKKEKHVYLYKKDFGV